MKPPRVAIETAERAPVEIAKLRPTAAEDAQWALERPRYARLAVLKFGIVPAVALAAGAVLSRESRPHHWWLWPILLGLSVLAGAMSWHVNWHIAEEPKQRLKSLRTARLRAALFARDVDDDEPAQPRGPA